MHTHAISISLYSRHLLVQITDADLCLEVMQKCSEKPLFLYRVLIPIIGENSLVIVGGTEHRLRRLCGD